MTAKTITLTEEQWRVLQKGGSITIEPPKKKRQPTFGVWKVYSDGSIRLDTGTREDVDFGTHYPTREAAERASKQMRRHNRLLAWLAENDDGWMVDENSYSQDKWFVAYNAESKKWQISYHTYEFNPLMVYMSAHNASKLCTLLNEGVVEL